MANPLGALRRRPVVGRLLFYGVVVVLVVPAAFCHVMTRAPGGPVEPLPDAYAELELAADGLRHRAWLRAGDPALPAFVVVHGLGDSLSSFVPFAERLNARGHSVLLPQLRGHGASRAATTLGGREREEVRAALDHLRREGLADSGVGLMGFSMGAVAALRAAAGRDDVVAVIAEAPYDSYRETVARHARLLYGLPRWVPLIPISVAFAEWRAGFDADEVDAVAAARRLRAPLLAIADERDPRMPPEVVRRVVDAHPGPSELWVAPDADHIGAVLHPDYWPRVLGFLEAHGVSPVTSPEA